jgi:hypothetical protein
MKIKMTRRGENIKSVAYAAGAAFGVLAVGVAAIFLSAWVIHWILGATGLAKLTYAQVVGLVAIWEIIKPRTESK